MHWFRDKKRISVLLTIASAFLYAVSLAQANFEIGFFGSIHSLPVSFFIALSLLTIASAILWISPRPHGKLLGLQLALFVLMVHLTMLAIVGPGGAQASAQSLYSDFGLNEYLYHTGHFNSPPSHLWRLNWPGAMIINAIVMLLTGNSDPGFLISLSIFIWIPLATIIIFLFLRSVLGNDKINYCMAGTWIFFLGNWTLYNIMPSVLGYLFLFVILGLVARIILRDQQRKQYLFDITCLLLVLVILPTTHLLTALVASVILVALLMIIRIKRFALPQPAVTSRIKVWHMAFLLVIIIGMWSLLATAEFMSWRLPIFIEQIQSVFRLDMLWNLGVTSRMAGNESHLAVNILRLSCAALFAIIGLIGGILMLVKKEITNNDKYILIVAAGILGTSLFIGVAYEHELVQRAYLFMVPLIAYFGIKLLKRKITAVILTVLLIAAIPLHFVYVYGNMIVDYASTQDIEGIYFFHDHTTKGYITGANVQFPLGYMENGEGYHFIFVDDLRLYDNTKIKLTGLPHYVYFRSLDQDLFDFVEYVPREHITKKTEALMMDLKQNIDSIPDYDLLYSNEDMYIYAETDN